MKTKFIFNCGIVFCLLLSPQLQAEDIQPSEEIRLLRELIQQQELVLQVLKERLQSLEVNEKKDYLFTITADGIQYEGKPISEAQIRSMVGNIPKDSSVVISAEPNVNHKQLVFLFGLFGDAGINSVNLAPEKAE